MLTSFPFRSRGLFFMLLMLFPCFANGCRLQPKWTNPKQSATVSSDLSQGRIMVDVSSTVPVLLEVMRDDPVILPRDLRKKLSEKIDVALKSSGFAASVTRIDSSTTRPTVVPGDVELYARVNLCEVVYSYQRAQSGITNEHAIVVNLQIDVCGRIDGRYIWRDPIPVQCASSLKKALFGLSNEEISEHLDLAMNNSAMTLQEAIAGELQSEKETELLPGAISK